MALTAKQKEAQQRHYKKKKEAGVLRTDETREREREYNRRYRAANPEVFKAQRDRAPQEQKLRNAKAWRDKNTEKVAQGNKNWRARQRAMMYNARERARKAGLDFNLTKDYLDSITPTHCPVLGFEMRRGGGMEDRDFSFSIDRIVPELGYIQGNVIVVSHRANRLRSDATNEELQKIATFYTALAR